MYWGLRFLDDEKVIGTLEYLDDQITVFAGLYGVPAYCIWWMAPDKTKQIYLRKAFNLVLFKEANEFIYSENFIIKDAIFDVRAKKYRVYAESLIHDKLSKPAGITHTAFTVNKSIPISGKVVLTTLLSSVPDVVLIFDEPLIDLTFYTSVSFDYEMSYLDLITKICRDNRWEFYLNHNKIWISQAFVRKSSYVTATEKEWLNQKYVDYMVFKGITLAADTCEPGAIFEDKSRVIWVEYNVSGKAGDHMTFMVYNFANQFLTERQFVETLSGHSEMLGRDRLQKDYKQSPIILGKKYGTSLPTNIAFYEAKSFSADVRIPSKDLNTREFKTIYVGNERRQIGADDVKITTPYAGNMVGIQFPQGESHNILFTPDGERELALVGPAFYGFGEGVPARVNAEDFRLQLPDGTVIYNQNNSKLIITAPLEIDMTVGAMPALSTIAPEGGAEVKLDTVGAEITSPTEIALIEVQDNKIHIELGANTIDVSPTDVKINQTTFKVTQGLVEIVGNLKVSGIVDANLIKGQSVFNVTGPMSKKIPPP